MSIRELRVPDIGSTSEVEVLELCASCDMAVSKGETLIVVQSDKATMDIPAEESGEITELCVSIGDHLKTGDLIAKMRCTDGSDDVSDQRAESTPKASAPSMGSSISPSDLSIVEEPETIKEGEEYCDVCVPTDITSNRITVTGISAYVGQLIQNGTELCTLEIDGETRVIESEFSGQIFSTHREILDIVRPNDKLFVIAREAARDKRKKEIEESNLHYSSPTKSNVAETDEFAIKAEDFSQEPTFAASAQEQDDAVDRSLDDVEEPISPSENEPQTETREVYAGPAVRRIARENQIDLSKVPSSSGDGRISRADIEAYIEKIGVNVQADNSTQIQHQDEPAGILDTNQKDAGNIDPFTADSISDLVTQSFDLPEDGGEPEEDEPQQEVASGNETVERNTDVECITTANPYQDVNSERDKWEERLKEQDAKLRQKIEKIKLQDNKIKDEISKLRTEKTKVQQDKDFILKEQEKLQKEKERIQEMAANLEEARNNKPEHTVVAQSGSPEQVEEVKKLSGIEKISALRLQQAWAKIPHVTNHMMIDVTDLEAFRKKVSEETFASEGMKITLLPFIVTACIGALKKYPKINSSFNSEDTSLTLKKYYNIGIAVDTSKGLFVPVLHQADSMSVKEIARNIGELAKEAHAGKLPPNLMKGGTFTISNLGRLGGVGFTPIINPPEVAILGVSNLEKRLELVDGQVVERIYLPLSLSYDHRAINGADAGKFFKYVEWILNDIRQGIL